MANSPCVVEKYTMEQLVGEIICPCILCMHATRVGVLEYVNNERVYSELITKRSTSKVSGKDLHQEKCTKELMGDQAYV